MALSNQTIRQILVENKIISESDFEKLEAESVRSNIPAVRLLIAQGKVSQRKYLELVSAFLDIPIFEPTTQALKLDTVAVLPETVARQKQALVFSFDDKKRVYQVAMIDPTDIENLTFLKEYLKADIQPFLASPDSLKFGYQLYKRQSSEQFESLIASKVDAFKSSISETEDNILENIPLVELVDTIIGYAATLDASDVYFQPQEETLKIRFRVDGILRDIISVDRSITEGIVARVKALTGLRIDEHFRPQDGRFRFRSSDIDLDIRVAVMPTIFGEKVTLRLLSGIHTFLSFEELGVSAETVERLQAAIKKPHGMILSTGPTGSGKTTTIYSILYILNRPEVHIVTIEDPVEYIIPNVSQTQTNVQAGITFADGLRSILRHSPDVIIVGEIRDSETTDISVNAALTGHLLISSLHTNDAPSAVVRLIDLGVQPFLVSATLNAVLAQRLARKICPNCKEKYVPEQSMLTKLKEDALHMGKTIELPKELYRGTGCGLCHRTGYQGRVGLFELFTIDEEIRTLIGSKSLTLSALRTLATKQGMTTIFEDGVAKIKSGLTTLEELIRVTTE